MEQNATNFFVTFNIFSSDCKTKPSFWLDLVTSSIEHLHINASSEQMGLQGYCTELPIKSAC